MDRIIAMLAAPTASTYTFFSGIFTSIATNLLTGDPRASTGKFDLFGAGTFTIGQMSSARIVFLLSMGASLFWLGYIRENSTRKADFVRGDLTTEAEYLIIVRSGLKAEGKSAMLAFALFLMSIAGATNISFLI